jgi:YVTN family beta-propeller protein
MKISKLLLSIFLLSVLLVSCNDDDDEPQLPKGDYENGVLVSGEGSGAGAGSVYFYADDYITTEKQIYKKVNGFELGTYLQSMAFDDSRAYIVVDNQNTVTVINRYTFEKLGAITTGLEVPRYMTVYKGKGYITNWGNTTDDSDDFIAVVDLTTYEVTSTVSVGNGPERIIADNGKLYVSHKGAWTTNNIISVIDTNTLTSTEITVNDNPDELFIDNSGHLIVLCEGLTLSYNPDWTPKEKTPVSITKINTNSNEISSELIFGDGQYPSYLTCDGNEYYYNLGNKIYSINQSSTTLPASELIDISLENLYGIAVKNGNLFVLDASYTAESDLNIYDLTSKNMIKTFKAPIGASKIYFN